MGQFDIAESAFAGVRLLARRPLSALVWSLLFVSLFAVTFGLFGATIIPFVSAFMKPGAKPDPATLLTLIGGVLGAYFFYLLGALVIGSMVSAAVIRAVLEPDDASFAYLRLGRRELWLMLVTLTQGLLVFIAQIVITIPVTLVFLAISSAWPGEALAARIVGDIVLYAVLIFIFIRLSMAAPMTFSQRQFRLFESWALTRGHAWRLFLVGVLVALMAAGVYAVLAGVGVGVGIALWDVSPLREHPKTLLTRPPSEWLRALGPIIGLVAVLTTLGITIITPIMYAPWSFIFKRINPEADVASTFA